MKQGSASARTRKKEYHPLKRERFHHHELGRPFTRFHRRCVRRERTGTEDRTRRTEPGRASRTGRTRLGRGRERGA